MSVIHVVCLESKDLTSHIRISAVEACRWATQSVGDAPYVTQLDFIDKYACKYVVHGDDITSDSSGEDCYRFVKAAGRFLVVKRTPGISTTDLVGRMLLCTRTHFIKSLTRLLDGAEGGGSEEERKRIGGQMRARIGDYATDETGLKKGAEVWSWSASVDAKEQKGSEEAGEFGRMVEGVEPRKGQRIVYVDGGFDLFSSGHIEFLRQVYLAEQARAKSSGWFEEAALERRLAEHGSDYGPAYVVAGIHDDEVINHWKGVNYPIMNIFERGLCVLQCKVYLSQDPRLVIARSRSLLTLSSTFTPPSSQPLSHQRNTSSPLFHMVSRMRYTTAPHHLCH